MPADDPTAPAVAQPDFPDTWPVIWRVVAPGAGSLDHDMVLTETEDEQEARASLLSEQRSGWPVRLERVSCGPLPEGSQKALARLRDANPQNPGTEMREVVGYWEVPAARPEQPALRLVVDNTRATQP